MKQSDLEAKMAQLTTERGTARLAAQKEAGIISETSAGRHLLRETVSAVLECLKDGRWLPDSETPVKRILLSFPEEVLAAVSVQILMDSVSKQQTVTKVAGDIGSALEDEARLAVCCKKEPLLFNKVSMVADRNRDTRWMRKRRLYAAFNREAADVLAEPWDPKVRLQVGMKMLGVIMTHGGLVEVYRKRPRRGAHVRPYLRLTDEVTDWLQEADLKSINLHPYYLPCVAVPLDWKGAFGGGYHTNQILKKPLVRTWDKRYLQELEQAEMAPVYRAVNSLQRTAWAVNEDVYQLMKWAWDEDLQIGGLPPRDELPLPEKPEHFDPKNNPEHKAFTREVARLKTLNNKSRAARVTVFKVLHMAEVVKDAGRHFYPHFTDFRGRLYPLVSFLQPQGTDEARGLLKFADGEAVDTPAAEFWLAIAGANAFGIDKVPHEERREWVREKERMIRAVADDPADCLWWSEADKPWSFLAWCLEWGAYLDHQESEETEPFLSHLPCPQDGSNNGLQIFSLLMRDPVGGSFTNCIGTGQVEDIYQEVADKVTVKLLEASTTPDENSQESYWAHQWLEFCGGKLGRKACKRPVMVLPYGGTLFSCHEYVVSWLNDEILDTGKANPFPSDQLKPSMFLSRLIWQSIHETVDSAQVCMAWLREAAGICADHSIGMRWTAPSGFPVTQRYLKSTTVKVETVTLGKRIFASSSIPTNEIDPRKQQNGISPNFVHSLDAACAALTIERLYEAGVRDFSMIHDSYGVHAKHTELLNKTLREVFAEVFQSPLLDELKAELESYLPPGVTLPNPPEVGDMDPRQVLTSPYFFA